MVFFFKQKTAYEIVDCDWSSDVCSSDLMIGKIPAVILYNSKSHKRGIGQSDLTDIADLQK